jgi:hypothetical protein
MEEKQQTTEEQAENRRAAVRVPQNKGIAGQVSIDQVSERIEGILSNSRGSHEKRLAFERDQTLAQRE